MVSSPSRDVDDGCPARRGRPGGWFGSGRAACRLAPPPAAQGRQGRRHADRGPADRGGRARRRRCHHYGPRESGVAAAEGRGWDRGQSPSRAARQGAGAGAAGSSRGRVGQWHTCLGMDRPAAACRRCAIFPAGTAPGCDDNGMSCGNIVSRPRKGAGKATGRATGRRPGIPETAPRGPHRGTGARRALKRASSRGSAACPV